MDVSIEVGRTSASINGGGKAKESILFLRMDGKFWGESGAHVEGVDGMSGGLSAARVDVSDNASSSPCLTGDKAGDIIGESISNLSLLSDGGSSGIDDVFSTVAMVVGVVSGRA